MSDTDIVFEQIRSGGCLSYLLGSNQKKLCVVIDPEQDKTEEYLGPAEYFSSHLL